MSWVTVTNIPCHSVVRRSGNYHPSIWNDDFIQSLKSEYAGEPYLERIRSLKSSVRDMLNQSEDDLDRLEMIDALQRLGLAYHFEEEIETVLANVYDDMMCKNISQSNEDLYGTLLNLDSPGSIVTKCFQVFNNFKEEDGNFRACLCEDIKGMLHLYEASFHLIEGESIMKEARDFTTKNLQNYVRQCSGGSGCLYVVATSLTNSYHFQFLKWADLGKSYSLEAEWYHSGHTPTLREYFDNALITVTAPVILVHTYFYVTGTPLDKETSEIVVNYPETIRLSSMVVRLADDLGTSSFEMKRGDNPKSIQCYMHETEASEEEARQHVVSLINETWKKINGDRMPNCLQQNWQDGWVRNWGARVRAPPLILRKKWRSHCQYLLYQDIRGNFGKPWTDGAIHVPIWRRPWRPSKFRDGKESNVNTNRTHYGEPSTYYWLGALNCSRNRLSICSLEACAHFP